MAVGSGRDGWAVSAWHSSRWPKREAPTSWRGSSLGGSADIALSCLSPVALRPRLSTGLPFLSMVLLQGSREAASLRQAGDRNVTADPLARGVACTPRRLRL